MIRLYRADWSTNCERVALALAHKRLEVESIVIDYGDRSIVEQASGQGLVPVIDDDGRVIADSTRILRYLEERNPEPPLFPRDPARRAELDVFLDWFNRVWKHAPNAIEAEPARTAELALVMGEHLDLFERMLDGREYLFGDDFSAADCAAFPFLKYAAYRDPADDEKFHVILGTHQSVEGRPNLAAWIARLDERPRA
ncbi:MAG: glutathione S-transferase family protein [Thermoleophilaceae bacterium]